jgi:hypothetical protein
VTPNKGVLTVHWRTEEPTSETFEGVHDVRVKGAFLVIRHSGSKKRKLVQVLMFPVDAIDSVEFDERVTYAGVWDDA